MRYNCAIISFLIFTVVPTILMPWSGHADSTNSSASKLVVQLVIDNSRVFVDVSNTSSSAMFLLGHGYVGTVPPPEGLQIRVKNPSGKIYQHSVPEPGGWWTPRFLVSQAYSIDKMPRYKLNSLEHIFLSYEFKDLASGMRLKAAEKLEACHIQIRMQIFWEQDSKRGEYIQKSKWIPVNCETLF